MNDESFIPIITLSPRFIVTLVQHHYISSHLSAKRDGAHSSAFPPRTRPFRHPSKRKGRALPPEPHFNL